MRLDELQALVVKGETNWEQYGDVKATYHDGMVLFNYTPAAQYANRWNKFERISRGLILDAKTGEVLARPFDKFWNWGERGRKGFGHITLVTEKLDGSLGILYRRDGYTVATRGSFTSDQALWATEYLAKYHSNIQVPDEATLLFEVIYPDNRVVVDYHGREDLVLLAIRNRFTGKYLPFYPDLYEVANLYGFSLPRVFDFNNVSDILAAAGELDANSEGWVIEMSNGSRWKVKGDAYVEVHRLVSQASYRRVVEAIAEGRLSELIKGIPDELLGDVRQWEEEIRSKVDLTLSRVEKSFRAAPKESRKQFAMWVTKNYPEDASYLFAKLDGKDVRSLIYKREF